MHDLHKRWAEVGRDPETIQLSTQYRIDFSDLSRAVREAQGFIDAGTTRTVLNMRRPFVAGMPTRLADEAISPIRPATVAQRSQLLGDGLLAGNDVQAARTPERRAWPQQ